MKYLSLLAVLLMIGAAVAVFIMGDVILGTALFFLGWAAWFAAAVWKK